MCSRWYVTIKGIVRVSKVCLGVYSFSWCYSLEATVLKSSFHFTALCVSYLFIYLIFSLFIFPHMVIYFQFYLSIFLFSSGAFIVSSGTSCTHGSGAFFGFHSLRLCLTGISLTGPFCVRYTKGPSGPPC